MVLLEIAALYAAMQVAPGFDLGLIPFALLFVVGYVLWRRWPDSEQPQEADDWSHLDQLERWCDRIGIGTPEVLAHVETKRGERYYLRVAMPDEDGKLMTPEAFHGYWPKFRAVAGDGCRGVFISKPDREHGGRCTMDVYWRDPDPTDAIVIQVTDSETRYAYSPAEAQAICDEYGLPASAAWGIPNVANRVGEG